MITRDEQTFESELKDKKEIARDIIHLVFNLTQTQSH